MNQPTRHPRPLDGVTVRRLAYEADLSQPRHHHERTSLTMIFGGWLRESVGASREEAGPLSVVYKPAGTEHANRVGPDGAATIQIEFERGFLPFDVDGGADWRWVHGGGAAAGFLSLIRQFRLEEGAPGERETRLFEVLSEFTDDLVPYEPPPDWLFQVVEELEDTFRRPRSVRALASEAAVHPVALARAHRRHYGCSITERIRARRVREAAGRLAAGDPASRVAYLVGFSDQPHMSRVFKRETGVTPGAYRKLVAG